MIKIAAKHDSVYERILTGRLGTRQLSYLREYNGTFSRQLILNQSSSCGSTIRCEIYELLDSLKPMMLQYQVVASTNIRNFC